MIAVQAISDVVRRFLIAGSRGRFAAVSYDFLLFRVDWEIFGLKRFGHCIISRIACENKTALAWHNRPPAGWLLSDASAENTAINKITQREP